VSEWEDYYNQLETMYDQSVKESKYLKITLDLSDSNYKAELLLVQRWAKYHSPSLFLRGPFTSDKEPDKESYWICRRGPQRTKPVPTIAAWEQSLSWEEREALANYRRK
jgi:hypothetical protein